MKIVIRLLLISIIITGNLACSEKVRENSNLSEDQNEIVDQNSDSNPTVENQEMSDILKAYLDLKDALVETDSEKAQNAAQEFLTSLESDSEVTNSELKEEVQKVAETTDIKVQRSSFDLISVMMVDLAKSADLSSVTLYKQYCPMAKNNEGAFWLSNSSEIRNPYFGDQMLKCGSVLEEI